MNTGISSVRDHWSGVGSVILALPSASYGMQTVPKILASVSSSCSQKEFQLRATEVTLLLVALVR